MHIKLQIARGLRLRLAHKMNVFSSSSRGGRRLRSQPL